MSSYLGNPQLKDANVKVQWTQHRIDEFNKCADDPNYFITKYVKVITLDEGVSNFALWPFQKKLIDTVHNNRFVITKWPRQSGKALSIDTPIITPTGFKTMGELKVGDSVIGKDGKPTKITMATDIMYDHVCYKLTFDNDDVVIADAEHLWEINSSGWRHGKSKIKTTEEFKKYWDHKKEKASGVYIKLPNAIEFSEKNLPIDPYILGAWLGDGHSAGSRFTQLPDDMETIGKYIIGAGYSLSISNSIPKGRARTWTIKGLSLQLRENNLIKNKHIPNEYLFGSIDQRISLLQGLMDTDGTCSKTKGGCSFSQKKKNIIDQFRQILSSLGVKSRIKSRMIKGQIYYSVHFKTHNFDVFRLERKRARQYNQIGKERKNTKVLYVKTFEKIESVPVKCIAVDNPDHIFLCGKTMIPTHNSTVMVAYFLHTILFNKHKRIGILANKREQAVDLLSRLQLAFELLPQWLQQGVKTWNKTSIELENGCRVEAHATSGQSVRGKTFNIVMMDEFAHIEPKLADKFWTSTFPVISSGKTSKIIIVSTPNGMNLFYELWTKAVLEHKDPNWNKFEALEIHYSEVPGREDPKWAAEQISIMGQDRFDQEFGTEFLGSSATLISKRFFKQMVVIPPIHSQNGLDVWEDPKVEKDPVSGVLKKHVYVITVDAARGRQLDYSAFCIIDVTDSPYKVVAKYRSNTIPVPAFADVIIPIAKRYNGAYVLVEVDGPGHQVVDDLHFIHEYDNILTVTTKGRSGQMLATGFGNQGKNVQRGLKMSPPVRRTGCTNLKTLIESRRLLMVDLDIKNELSNFVLVGDRYEADEGKHDDLVMTLVTFSWLTTQKHFRDLMEAKVRQSLVAEYEPQLQHDATPYGWIDNGLDKAEVIVKKDCIWTEATGGAWNKFFDDQQTYALRVYDKLAAARLDKYFGQTAGA